jgi:hypothetical protein
MNSRQRREGRRIALTQYDELEAIYARIPRIECKGLCHTSCGHIGLSEIEALRMRQYDGKDAPHNGPDCQRTIDRHRLGYVSEVDARQTLFGLPGTAGNLPALWGGK